MKRLATIFVCSIPGIALWFLSAHGPAANAAAPGSNGWTSVWGAESNSLSAGFLYRDVAIHIGELTNWPGVLGYCSLTIRNISSNQVGVWLPPSRQRDEFIVTDGQGRTVSRTDLGQAAGTVSETNAVVYAREASRKLYAWMRLDSHAQTDYQSVVDGIDTTDFGKFFRITNAGDYTITRYARVCFVGTNSVLMAVVLPPVSMPLRVVGDKDPGKAGAP